MVTSAFFEHALTPEWWHNIIMCGLDHYKYPIEDVNSSAYQLA